MFETIKEWLSKPDVNAKSISLESDVDLRYDTSLKIIMHTAFDLFTNRRKRFVYTSREQETTSDELFKWWWTDRLAQTSNDLTPYISYHTNSYNRMVESVFFTEDIAVIEGILYGDSPKDNPLRRVMELHSDPDDITVDEVLWQAEEIRFEKLIALLTLLKETVEV